MEWHLLVGRFAEMDFLYNVSEPSNASEELAEDGNETAELGANMSHWCLV